MYPFQLEQACLGLKLTTAAKLEDKSIKKQNKKKKTLSFADDHGQPLFTGILLHRHSFFGEYVVKDD